MLCSTNQVFHYRRHKRLQGATFPKGGQPNKSALIAPYSEEASEEGEAPGLTPDGPAWSPGDGASSSSAANISATCRAAGFTSSFTAAAASSDSRRMPSSAGSTGNPASRLR